MAAYRARLDTQGSSSMVVRIGGKEEVRTDASKGPTVAGSWSGDVLVLPGQEQGVSLACSTFGLAEIVVYGQLVDDPREASTGR